jgi:aspartyl-tRNA(Asn)/glutamyl-tRNA(Gln) amidotransferase subunit C
MKTFGCGATRRGAPGPVLMTSDYDTLFSFVSAVHQADFPSYMPLSLDDIQRIAHLARIEITPLEAADVGTKLDGIFALIGRLRAVDTTGIVPMSHAQEVMLPLREDHVSEVDRRELYQRLAPAVQDGLYLVPKVIE